MTVGLTDVKYRFQALGRKVAIIEREPERVTPGGIQLPDTAQEKPSFGVVQSVGSQVTEVKPGDVVSYFRYSGVDQEIPGGVEEELLVVSDDDLLGVLIPAV